MSGQTITQWLFLMPNAGVNRREPQASVRLGEQLDGGALHTHIASASAHKSFAPSPRQALPCMHARVVGCVEASLSSMWRAFLVWEK